MKSREQIIQEIKSINTKYLNQDTMNWEPIEVLSDKTINELADIWMEREKDKEQKQIKPQKLSKKVINIDCPYKGKHKYELTKEELREYEKIKKRLQRAKLNNNKIILYLVDSIIKYETNEITGYWNDTKYYIYKDKNNNFETHLELNKPYKRISCYKYFDENTNEWEIDCWEPL